MLIIILDSCRLDSYLNANTEIIDKAIGLPQKAMTKCNHTIGSFAHFMLLNDFPEPNNIPKQLWAAKNRSTHRYFFTDNPHLDKTVISATTKDKWFNLYKVFKKTYNSTDEMIEMCRQINPEFLKQPHVIYLWFGQTHQPFFLNDKRIPGWTANAKNYPKYNMGEDCIDADFFKLVKRTQTAIVEEILSKLWIRFLGHYKGDVIITSDHGESCGEISPFDGNHKAGHGNDIHPVQFEVPLVHGRTN